MHVQHVQSLPALERLEEHVAPMRVYCICCASHDISGIGAKPMRKTTCCIVPSRSAWLKA